MTQNSDMSTELLASRLTKMPDHRKLMSHLTHVKLGLSTFRFIRKPAYVLRLEIAAPTFANLSLRSLFSPHADGFFRRNLLGQPNDDTKYEQRRSTFKLKSSLMLVLLLVCLLTPKIPISSRDMAPPSFIRARDWLIVSEPCPIKPRSTRGWRNWIRNKNNIFPLHT